MHKRRVIPFGLLSKVSVMYFCSKSAPSRTSRKNPDFWLSGPVQKATVDPWKWTHFLELIFRGDLEWTCIKDESFRFGLLSKASFMHFCSKSAPSRTSRKTPHFWLSGLVQKAILDPWKWTFLYVLLCTFSSRTSRKWTFFMSFYALFQVGLLEKHLISDFLALYKRPYLTPENGPFF